MNYMSRYKYQHNLLKSENAVIGFIFSPLRTFIRCITVCEIGQTGLKIVQHTSSSKAIIVSRDIVSCLYSFIVFFVVVYTGNAKLKKTTQFRVGAFISM